MKNKFGTKYAKMFWAEHDVTAADARHMLHNQLNVRWGLTDRGWDLCRVLKERLRTGPPGDIDRLVEWLDRRDARLQRKGERGLPLGSVLGDDELRNPDWSELPQRLNLAAAAVILAGFDWHDAATGANLVPHYPPRRRRTPASLA